MSSNQTLSERPTLEPRWLFPVIDAVLAFLVFGLAYVLRYDWQIIRPVLDPLQRDFGPYIPFAAVYAILIWMNYQRNGLYRNIVGRAWMEEVYLIGSSVAVAIVVVLAMFFIFQPLVTSRLMLIYVAALTILFSSLSRLIRRWVLAYLRNKGIGIQRVLIIGMSEVGHAVLGVMIARPELGYKPIGFLDDTPETGDVDIGRVEGLGNTNRLRETISSKKVDMVVITFRWKHYNRIQELAEVCRSTGVNIRIVPDIMQLNMRQVQVENLDGIPLLGFSSQEAFSQADRLLKRAMDILLVTTAFPIWGTICALVALAIKLEGDGGSILFQQERVGEDGRKFEMLKFRSMIPGAEKLHAQMVAEAGEDPRHAKFEDDERITRVGKFLRRSSLDEFPNFINVLRGQMSIVGPRPPTPDEVQLYEPWQARRLQVTPGMTGLWQVSGRSDVPFEEMCLMDIYYIENWSITMDIRILMMTIPKVILRSGAY
jgi:exopolysaccharide biosynthesis polyprenyl glycosylphosphotransferase